MKTQNVSKRLKTILVLGFLSIGVMGAKSCQTSVPLETLCIIEGDICWKNKEEGIGYRLVEMTDWYCLDQNDFDRVADRLVECKKLEETCK